ncbi:MAG: hypothetical protein Roseis2KO_07610 [Roseivirga sp.]
MGSDTLDKRARFGHIQLLSTIKAFYQIFRRLGIGRLLVILSFSTLCNGPASFAQNPASDVLDIQTFRFREGLDIGYIQSIEFDEEGWIWLSGLESETGANDFLNKGVKLQRFDGLSFHNVPLPSVPETSFVHCMIEKREDGLFFIRIASKTREYLYLFDPMTFALEEIKMPDEANFTLISGMKLEGDITYLALDYGINTYLYALDSALQFKKLFPLEREHAGDSFVTLMVKYDDHFLISEDRIGIYAYSLEGEKLRFFDYKDLKLSRPHPYKPLILSRGYQKGNEQLFETPYARDAYLYDPIVKEFRESDFRKPYSKKQLMVNAAFRSQLVTDNFGNVMTAGFVNRQIVFNRHLKSDNFVPKSYKISSNGISSMGSRDLEKELFLGENGRLLHITFRQSGVVNFLRDQNSIRSIFHWQDNEFLVASEFKGWFIIDVEKETERPFELTVNGEPFVASEVRGISRDKDGIWSNYNGGVILIDPDTHEVELFRHYPVWTMADAGDSILYGSFEYPLMVFDKRSRENRALSKHDSLTATDIELWKDRVYMTTPYGLFRYEKGKEAFVELPGNRGDLMMLEQHDSLGILVTNTLGDVYHFDPENEVPHLLYRDSLANPIASILTDDHGGLWLNTFSGITSLDPGTGQTQRYYEEDGLTYNEANRYSALKTADGSFLVGSLEGVSYFHPDEIKKEPSAGQLRLTSLTYFSKKKKENVTEGGRMVLKDIEQITLPSENRYLKIEVAPSGVINSLNTNIRYRLNDGLWQTMYKTGVIELMSLSAGDYTLEAQLVNVEDKPIGEPLMLKINAREIFYRTTWFIVLVILFISIVSYYFIRQANRAKALEQGYSRSLLKVQEGERSRISRELHDSVGQQLILLKNQAKMQDNEEMVRTASETLEEVRTITRDLHPVVLKQLGLTAALEELIHKLDENTEIFFTTELDNIDGLLDETEELNLYRIVQEALNNIVKHAGAISARMTVKRRKSKLRLTIEDNGRGFVLEEGVGGGNSLGLKTLNERATMLNAKLSISSSDAGTQIVLEVPR